MSYTSNPINISSGRRLVIDNVTDTASFSARRLSFNAKELQFLCNELAKWLTEMYEDDVDPDLSQSLISGVILLTIVERYLPQIKLPRWHKNASPISFQARDNISAFATACVALGMRRSDVCNFSNFEKGDLKQITATLCAFAKLGIPQGLNKVSEDLQVFVDQAYTAPVKVLEIVEEEVKLTEEELAQIEREKQEALERQQKIEALTKDIEKERDDFLDAYNRAVNILCQDFVQDVLDFGLSDSESDSDSDSSDREKSIPLSEDNPLDSKREHIDSAKKEMESASVILTSIKEKREFLEAEGSDVTDIQAAEADLKSKLEELQGLISKEEEEMERMRQEEEERKRLEEEERLRKEEEERKRREEEEERLRREEEERLKREEEERIRIVEEERIKREAEEAERKRQEEEKRRQEEEAERKRQEEEAERKRQEEEAERKRQEEEAERKRLEEEALKELERLHEEEERKLREEEEAAAKRKCACRNKRPKYEEEEEEEVMQQEQEKEETVEVEKEEAVEEAKEGDEEAKEAQETAESQEEKSEETAESQEEKSEETTEMQEKVVEETTEEETQE